MNQGAKDLQDVPAAQGTHSAPMFVQMSEDLVQRLTADQSASGQLMLREAQDLAQRFHRWATERPSNEIRVVMIQELFNLSRRVMDHLSRNHTPPPPPAEPPAGDGLLKRLFKRSPGR
jgi:hypothetical protein